MNILARWVPIDRLRMSFKRQDGDRLRMLNGT
jgi:hypothetical protein